MTLLSGFDVIENSPGENKRSRPQAATDLLRRRASLGVILLGSLSIAGYMTLLPADVQNIAYDFFAPITVLIIIGGTLRQRPSARWIPWIFLALGIFAFWIGDLLTSSFLVGEDIPPLGPGDVAYVAGYVALFLAIWYIVSQRIGGNDRAGFIDATILSGACAFIFTTLMVDYFTQNLPTSFGDVFIVVLYPGLDLIMVWAAFLLLLSPGRHNRSLLLLIVSFAVFTASDLANSVTNALGGYVPGTFLDIGWLAMYVLVAAAAVASDRWFLTERVPVQTNLLSRRRSFMLLLALFVVPATTILEVGRGITPHLFLLTGAGFVLPVLVMARITALVRDLRTSTEERAANAEAYVRSARTDILTGLPNRVTFLEHVAQEMVTHPGCALLLVDLCDFGVINETYGYPVGDEVLRLMGGRLSSLAAPDALIARMAGDEFGIVFPGPISLTRLEATGQTCCEIISYPLDINGTSHILHGAVGITMADNLTPNAEQLVREADIAKDLARNAGAGSWRIFDHKATEAITQRLTLRADLERAVANHEFYLLYQPEYRLADSTLWGVEALVRWNHPTRGLVPPDEFIGMAETSGLIVPLGAWITATACQQAAQWNREYPAHPLTVSINLSVVQMSHPPLVNDIAALLAANELDPTRIVLEVTESAFANGLTTVATLRQLQDLGVALAIDDFGTGYSSLSSLRDLPVRVLKIDRSFITRLDGGDAREGSIVEAIVHLARQMGFATVAEGIETATQLATLQRLGVDFGQGYLLSRPVTATAIDGLLRQESAAMGIALPASEVFVR